MESKSSLTFSFCGDCEVNAMALSEAISSLVEVSSVIAEKEFPDIQFRMSISAITPGSLRFDFIAYVVMATQTLFTPENVSYAANLIDAVSGAFSIKKFLKGKAPKEKRAQDDKIIITHPDGSKLEIPQSAGVYFIDNRIDSALSRLVRAAQTSAGTTGVSVSTDKLPKVEIERGEFDDCLKEIDFPETINNSITSVRQKEVLFIRQAAFSDDLKWKFIGDHNITANILDKDFLDDVKSGNVPITGKTYIIADVRVTISLGVDGTPDESKSSYDIIKVHEIHTVGEGQLKLDT